MDVAIFNDNGDEINERKGELVCKTTFPSKPLFFWNDKNNHKLYNKHILINIKIYGIMVIMLCLLIQKDLLFMDDQIPH